MLLQIQIDGNRKIIFKCKEPLLSPLKLQKIQIRMNKENSLLSQQDQKAAMDKQIIDIEKLINWVERIKM